MDEIEVVVVEEVGTVIVALDVEEVFEGDSDTADDNAGGGGVAEGSVVADGVEADLYADEVGVKTDVIKDAIVVIGPVIVSGVIGVRTAIVAFATEAFAVTPDARKDVMLIGRKHTIAAVKATADLGWHVVIAAEATAAGVGVVDAGVESTSPILEDAIIMTTDVEDTNAEALGLDDVDAVFGVEVKREGVAGACGADVCELGVVEDETVLEAGVLGGEVEAIGGLDVAEEKHEGEGKADGRLGRRDRSFVRLVDGKAGILRPASFTTGEAQAELDTAPDDVADAGVDTGHDEESGTEEDGDEDEVEENDVLARPIDEVVELWCDIV